MKKKLRTLLTLVLSMLLILGTAVSVSAASQAPRYIKVGLKHDKVPVDQNIKVQLHRIGDVNIPAEGTHLTYTIYDKFKGANVQINSIDDLYKKPDEISKAFYRYIINSETPIDPVATKESGTTGWVCFGRCNGGEDLPEGLYLVSQVLPEYKPGENFNVYMFQPYLVSVPSPDDNVGGGLSYSLSAVPKCEILEPVNLRAKKTWKGAKNTDYDKLEIEAQFIGEKAGMPNILINDVKLNKANNWMYETGPFYPKDYSWQVREVKVPDGYKVSYTDKKTVIDGNKPHIFEFEIVNTKIPPKPPLIQTGQLNWPIPLMAGLGLALILTGVVVSKHGRKKEQQ